MRQGYPYEPAMEECQLEVQTEGADCYIMDSCCRGITTEEQAETEKGIVRIYVQAVARRRE